MTLSVPEQICEDMVLLLLVFGFDAAALLVQPIGSLVLSEYFLAYVRYLGAFIDTCHTKALELDACLCVFLWQELPHRAWRMDFMPFLP